MLILKLKKKQFKCSGEFELKKDLEVKGFSPMGKICLFTL